MGAIYRRFESEEHYARRRFKHLLGYAPDLDNPQSYNEKLQWLKLNDRRAVYTSLVDKLAVREVVAQIMGEDHLIGILRVLDSADDLTPENLPRAPFVLKANHDSGSARIVRDIRDVNWEEIRHFFRYRLGRNFYRVGREWQYKGIIRRFILCEEYLEGEDGNPPMDFKFHCFNGKIEFIQADSGRFGDHRRTIYDPDWNLMDFELKYRRGAHVPCPENLSDMAETAKALSDALELPYARIDLYSFDGRVLFGEITLHPGGGFNPFFPPEADYRVGSLMELPPVTRAKKGGRLGRVLQRSR